MTFFKVGFGKELGVKLSKAEQKALDEELDRQCYARFEEFARRDGLEICAMVLWLLHEDGYTIRKMKNAYGRFNKRLEELRRRYELGNTLNDTTWLCMYKLSTELGIDLEEWEKEYEENMRSEADM